MSILTSQLQQTLEKIGKQTVTSESLVENVHKHKQLFLPPPSAFHFRIIFFFLFFFFLVLVFSIHILDLVTTGLKIQNMVETKEEMLNSLVFNTKKKKMKEIL